jgi:uncharacterized protein involved in copper resistance
MMISWRLVVKREYNPLIKQRWISQSRVELDWHGLEDAPRGIGTGLSGAEPALQLRVRLG